MRWLDVCVLEYYIAYLFFFLHKSDTRKAFLINTRNSETSDYIMVELNYAVNSAKRSKSGIKNHGSHGRMLVVVSQIFRLVALGAKVSSNVATNNNIPAMESISFYPILTPSSTINLINIFIPIRKWIFRTKYLFSQHNPTWPGWEKSS